MKKTNLLIFVSLLSTSLWAQDSFLILERRENSNRTFYKRVELPDLVSQNSFEGKYFKIVKGKSQEAILFTEQDHEVLNRAANVYWHLSKARDFWIKEMKSAYITSMPKITVRVDLTNVYDSQGHFAHDNRDPQYNNALSIPSGCSPEWVPEERRQVWEKEIWFRPMKKIDVKNLVDTLGPNPLTQTLSALQTPFLNYTQNRFGQTLAEHMFYPSYSTRPVHEDIIRFVGTVAITRAVIEASKYMDSLFMEKWYYLDTAMIPEIVYHEYSHVVLSENMEMSHSTPVIEGMADYFAAIQSKKKKVYGKVRGRSNASPKDPRNDATYSHWHESNSKANADFVLSVLWGVRETLGDKADQVIYEARTNLKTDTATISDHLIRAILKACESKCEKPGVDKLKLYEAFAKKGF